MPRHICQNNSVLEISNAVITGNNNRVKGDGNRITGNNNMVDGSYNQGVGNNNVIVGHNNSWVGNSNRMNGMKNSAVGNNNISSETKHSPSYTTIPAPLSDSLITSLGTQAFNSFTPSMGCTSIANNTLTGSTTLTIPLVNAMSYCGLSIGNINTGISNNNFVSAPAQAVTTTKTADIELVEDSKYANEKDPDCQICLSRKNQCKLSCEHCVCVPCWKTIVKTSKESTTKKLACPFCRAKIKEQPKLLASAFE